VTHVLCLGRRIAVVMTVAAAVRIGAGVTGPLLLAPVGAAALTVGALRWWARIEARLFLPRPEASPGERADRPAAADPHLAFAQALAVVATRYLAECRSETEWRGQTPPASRPAHQPGDRAR
jgi:hypothetical protein